MEAGTGEEIASPSGLKVAFRSCMDLSRSAFTGCSGGGGALSEDASFRDFPEADVGVLRECDVDLLRFFQKNILLP